MSNWISILNRASDQLQVVSFALLMPMALLAPRAAPVLLGVMMIPSLIKLIGGPSKQAFRAQFLYTLKHPAALFLFAALSYAALSILWAPQADKALSTLIKALLLFGLTLLIYTDIGHRDEATRRRLKKALFLGALPAIAVFLVEFIFHMPLRVSFYELINAKNPFNHLAALDRGVTLLSIFLWPVLFCKGGAQPLKLSFPWVWGIIFLSLLIGFLSSADAAFLAIIVGALIFMSYQLGWVFLARLIAGLTIFGVLLGPLTLSQALTPQQISDLPQQLEKTELDVNWWPVWARLQIWEFTMAKVAEQPVFGRGLNASRFIDDNRDKRPGYRKFIPLHSHNITLQLLLELGIIGVAFMLTLFAFATRYMMTRLAPESEKIALPMLSAIAIIAGLSYGMWQSWWLAALGIAAIVYRLMTGPRGTDVRENKSL